MRSIIAVLCGLLFPLAAAAQALPGTKLLESKDDLAKVMVDGIDRYLTKATELAAKERGEILEARFLLGPGIRPIGRAQPRTACAKIIGVIDERVPVAMSEYRHGRASVACRRDQIVQGVRGALVGAAGRAWRRPVAGADRRSRRRARSRFPMPIGRPSRLVGIAPGVPNESQYARRLAEDGYRVIVPTLINRKDDLSGNAASAASPISRTANSSTAWLRDGPARHRL